MSHRISLGDITKHLLLIVSGLILLIWTTYLIVSPAKYALGVILFLITFVTGELLLSRGRDKPIPRRPCSSHMSNHHFSGDFIAIALGVSSLLITLIPAIEGELCITWIDLVPLNVLRLVAAFTLNFLPGYLILTTLDTKPKLHGPAKLLASYFLSLFIITIIGFSYAQVRQSIDVFYPLILVLTNATIIVLYFYRRLGKLKVPTSSAGSFSIRNHKLLLLAVLLVLIIAFKYMWLLGSYEKIGFFIGGPGSDMWRQHGFAQSFLDGGAFTWLHVPWWFSLYLASFTVMSGVPSVNAYLALYPLMILSTLSFYVMVSGFSKNKTVATLATLAYTTFSGPGWLYALSLRGFAPVTNYASWISILWQTGGKFLFQGWYPPFTIGFVPSDISYAALWFMVYMAYRLDLRNRFSFVLLSIVSALSFLVHGVDIVIFILYLGAVLVAYLWTRNEEGKKKVRWVAFSVIATFILVAIIEVSLTGYYYWSESAQRRFDLPQYYYFDPLFYSAVGVSLVTLIALTYAKPSTQNVILKLLGQMKTPIIFAVCFLYILSLVIWIRELPTFNSGLIGVGPVPWYAYSATGGVPYFLALAGGTYLALSLKKLKNNTRDVLIFSVTSLALIFIFGRVVSFVNLNIFYTGFWERRILAYLHPIISTLAAYAIVIVFKRVNVEKPFGWTKFAVASFLISLILLSSISATLIALDFTTRELPNTLTEEELEALTYLHYSLPKGLKTAYLNRYTGINYIRAFANDKWTYDPRLWISQFGSSPQTILYMIAAGNLSLLYLHRTRDMADLKKNLFIQQLIKVLPVEFNNSAVTIYSVPPLHSPSAFSSLGIVPSDEDYDASNDAYTLWLFTFAVGKQPYAFMDFTHPRINSSQLLMVPYDPLPSESYIAKLLDWVANGGHLLVSNTNPYGTFSELLGLTSRVSLINGDSLDNWRTLYKRGEIFLEPSEKIEGVSSLRMRNNQSSWEEWRYNVTAATNGTNWDLSGYEYLGIWINSTGGGPQWYLHLTDSNDVTGTYRYDLSRWNSVEKKYIPTFYGWKLLLIPLQEYFGYLNLSNIKELKVVTGTQMPVNILVDDIFAMREQSSVMANGVEGKESLNLPSITVQTLSTSAETRIIANYTMDGISVSPFAVEKNLGAGKITYLNIKPLYDSIVSGASARASHEILTDILKVIDFQAPP